MYSIRCPNLKLFGFSELYDRRDEPPEETPIDETYVKLGRDGIADL